MLPVCPPMASLPSEALCLCVCVRARVQMWRPHSLKPKQNTAFAIIHMRDMCVCVCVWSVLLEVDPCAALGWTPHLAQVC